MTLQEKLKKNKDKPLALIVNGLSYEGVELAKLLLEQDSFVILVDDLSAGRELLGELEDSDLFAMIKPEGLPDLQEQVDKLDYMFFFQKWGAGSLTNSEFLKNVTVLEDALRFALDKEAKFILIDSIFVHRQILTENLTRRITRRKKSYSISEQQKYFEKLVTDYIDKYKLKGTILRMGKIYGPDMEFEQDDILGRMVKEALLKDKIIINAEGLEEHHYIYITDAVYGILKAQFSDESDGGVYSCKSDKETTELSIAYSLLEEDYKAKELDFREVEADVLEADDTQSLSIIGWTPKVSLQRGLKQTADSLKKKLAGLIKEEEEMPKMDKHEIFEDSVAKSTKKDDKESKRKKDSSKAKLKTKKDETKSGRKGGAEKSREKDAKSDVKKKSNAESIMEIFGQKYKKPVLDKTEKEKNKGGRLSRVTGLAIRKNKENSTIKIKAQKREEKFSLKGKFKFMGKVVVILIGAFLYFSIIAPSIKYAYNAYKVNREVISFDRSMKNRDGENMDQYALRAKEGLSVQREALKVPSTIIYLSNLRYDYVNDVKNRLYNYEKIFEDVYILSRYKQEVENLNSDMRFRIDTLGKTNSLKQIGGFDSSIEGRNLGEVIEDLNFRLDAEKDLSPLPMHKITQETLSKDYIYDAIQSLKQSFYYINMFLGIEKDVSNLLIFTDNRKASGIGGKPVVILRMDFSRGRIKRLDTTLVSRLLEQSKIDISKEIPNYEYASKHLQKSGPWESINLYEDANKVIGQSYKDVYDIEPNNYIYIGTNQLMEIIDKSGGIKYDNETLTSDNFYEVWDKENNKQDLVESIVLSVLVDSEANREKVGEYLSDEWSSDTVVVFNEGERIIHSNAPTVDFKISEVGEGKQTMLTRDKYLKLTYNEPESKVLGEISLDITRDKETEVKEVIEVTLPNGANVKNVGGLEDVQTRIRDLDGSSVTDVLGVLSSEGKASDIGFTIEFEMNNPEGDFDSYRFLKQAGLDDVKYRVIVASDSGSIKVEKFIEREGIYSYSGNFESDITFDVQESESN